MIPDELPLAEDFLHRSMDIPVDILIGNDYYTELLTGARLLLTDGLYMLDSYLGWILSGRITMPESSREQNSSLFVQCTPRINGFGELGALTTVDPMKPSWEDWCQLESIGITEDPRISDDDLAQEQFNSAVRFKDGRYHVSWPWMGNAEELPSNFGLAVGRLNSLLRRLEYRPDLARKYQAILNAKKKRGLSKKPRSHKRTTESIFSCIIRLKRPKGRP